MFKRPLQLKITTKITSGWNSSLPVATGVWIVLGLLTAGATTWYVYDRASTAQHSPRPYFPAYPRPRTHKNFTPNMASMGLGTTPDQQKQVEALYHDTDLKRTALHEQLRTKMHEYSLLFDQYQIDAQKEASLRVEIAQIQDSLLQVHFDNEQRLRQILTKDQLDRLRAIIREHRKGRGPIKDVPASALPTSVPASVTR